MPVNFLLQGRSAALGSVLGTTLFSVVCGRGIQRTSNDMIAHTREILDPTATNKHHRVLLQVVPYARNIAIYLKAVCQAHTSHLPQSRIRLFRRGGIDPHAYTPLLVAFCLRPFLTNWFSVGMLYPYCVPGTKTKFKPECFLRLWPYPPDFSVGLDGVGSFSPQGAVNLPTTTRRVAKNSDKSQPFCGGLRKILRHAL